MLKITAVISLLFLTIGSSQVRCEEYYKSLDELREAHPYTGKQEDHAYYRTIDGKKMWHLRNESEPRRMVVKAKPRKLVTKKELTTESIQVTPIQPNEQMLRSYLGLDCNMWLPASRNSYCYHR